MSELTFLEYRVREVKRFIVTRHYATANGGGTENKGEFDNAEVAHEVAYALARHDHETLGWPIDDQRIQYPKRDNGVAVRLASIPPAA